MIEREGEIETCRICQDEINFETERDQVISPCRCTGSMALIHVDCFRAWGKNTCEICGFRFFAGENPFNQGMPRIRYAPPPPQPMLQLNNFQDIPDHILQQQINQALGNVPYEIDDYPMYNVTNRLVRDFVKARKNPLILVKTWFYFLHELCFWEKTSLWRMMTGLAVSSVTLGFSFFAAPCLTAVDRVFFRPYSPWKERLKWVPLFLAYYGGIGWGIGHLSYPWVRPLLNKMLN